MPIRALAAALLSLLFLPAAATAGKPKLVQYSATSTAGGVATAKFGAIATSSQGNGFYAVELLDREDAVGCTAAASPTEGYIAFVTTERSTLYPAFLVFTYTHTGDAAPVAFHIVVHCPTP
jgi:hypothetical protein